MKKIVKNKQTNKQTNKGNDFFSAKLTSDE